MAPTGTPRTIIDRLNQDIATVLAHAEIVKALAAHGLDPAEAGSPEAFASFLRSEIDRWGKVIRASGAKAG